MRVATGSVSSPKAALRSSFLRRRRHDVFVFVPVTFPLLPVLPVLPAYVVQPRGRTIAQDMGGVFQTLEGSLACSAPVHAIIKALPFGCKNFLAQTTEFARISEIQIH